MTDPKCLSIDSSSELERVLLRAGRRARAPERARHRALAAATSAVATSGLAGGTAAAGAVAKTGAVFALKWATVVGLASLGAVAATGVVRDAVHDRLAPREPPRLVETRAGRVATAASTVMGTPQGPGEPAAVVVPVETSADEPTGKARTPSGQPARTATDPTPAPARSPGPALSATPILATAAAPAQPPRQPGPAGASMLPAELAMLARANAALGANDPGGALSILDAYARRFPDASLSPEASVLRIEALAKAGDLPAAQRAADAFAVNHPESPYAARIRAVLGKH